MKPVDPTTAIPSVSWKQKAGFSNWRNRWLVGLSIIVILLGALIVYSSQRDKRAFLTTSSPAGTYTVTLSGGKDRPFLPMLDHSVRLDVVKRGKLLLSNQELHSGDWLDASFNEWFSEHEWVSEQSLAFYREQFRKDLPTDSVVLKNATTKKVAFLKVLSVDMLIGFDFEPQSTATFVVSRARGDLKWTSVEGEFEGGKPITGATLDFDVTKKPGPYSFLITISENRTTVTVH